MQTGLRVGTGGLQIRPQQLSHCGGSQSQGPAAEQLSTGQVQFEVTKRVHGVHTGWIFEIQEDLMGLERDQARSV